MFLGLLFILVVVFAIYLITVQRNFVALEEMCDNALSQVGVQQQSRWDALTELAKATKSYSQHEHDTLMDVISQRNGRSMTNDEKAMQRDDKEFSRALSQIQLVAEQYPALRASELYEKTMDAISSYEDKVRKGRMVYNDMVTNYNRRVKQFPSNVVASIFNFHAKSYYELDEIKNEMPDLQI